jgi:putative membrane protein
MTPPLGGSDNASRRTDMKTLSATMLMLLLAAGVAVAQTKPNDAQIAEILTTANQADIDAGKLAESKASDKDVKSFGQEMVTDHSASNKSAAQLVKKLNIKPEQSSTSKTLKSGADENMKKLRGLSGAEFDKAYIDHEVEFHQTVLDAIDKTLLPSASNPELKSTITSTRPVIAAHLARAKSIQGKFGK